ncbi:MAG: hypothetical protein HY538_05600 [Deltaproteobacteria bacterium]|nr:hypothetical protein [Deltaproteobacteria bacterium]
MKESQVRIECESLASFLERYGSRITETGMPLLEAGTRSVGSLVQFEIILKEDYPLIRGVGQVVRTSDRSGVGGSEIEIKFLHLDKRGKAFIKKVMAHR